MGNCNSTKNHAKDIIPDDTEALQCPRNSRANSINESFDYKCKQELSQMYSNESLRSMAASTLTVGPTQPTTDTQSHDKVNLHDVVIPDALIEESNEEPDD